MTGTATLAIELAFAALLADAAISDLRGYRIPNRIPVFLILLFPLAAFALEPREILLHLLAGLSVFAVGAALFAKGMWGGGDAKLIAAVGIWTGFSGMPRFLAVMALAGGVLALTVLAARIVVPRAASPEPADAAWGQRFAYSGHLPYGVAIAVAGLDWILRAGLPA